MEQISKYLTMDDVAEILSISKSTLYKWVEKWAIPHYKINGNVRFNQEHLKNWIDSKQVKPLKKSA